MVQNKTFVFNSIPKGIPEAGVDIIIEDRPLDLDATPSEGSILIKNHYASFDPYQRGRMRDPSIKSYSTPFHVGSPVMNRTVAKVLKSSSSKFQPGDLILAMDSTPIAEYAILGPEQVEVAMKIDNSYNLSPKVFLGAVGMPGLTAYSSFYDIGQPKKGETIFISAASGAVGQLVGQLAKREGLTVLGSVGDDAKLDYILKELGFDGGFNYKKEKPADALKRLAPEGIDIYYENVGGEHLEAAIDSMKIWGRIIACGNISQYSIPMEQRYGVRNIPLIVGKRIKMQGFIVGDANMGPKYFSEFSQNVPKWISEGAIKTKMSETVGIDNAPEGFVGMLQGKNFGKAILVIDELEK